jgi:hypothetical protein
MSKKCEMQKKLVELSNEGRLGETIAEKLRGERGHTYPRKDADFLVIFDKEQGPPTVDQLEEVVVSFFKTLEYKVFVDKITQHEAIQFRITVDDDLELVLFINISTGYPFDGANNAIRVTTDFTG